MVIIMSTRMKAAIHLGEIYNDNFFTDRNTNFEALKTVFEVYLLHDKVIKLSKAKVHVYSDSVVCLGEVRRHRDAKARKESFGIDREPFEFEWSVLPGHITVEIRA